MKFKVLALIAALTFVAAACNKNNDAANNETNTNTPAAQNTDTAPAGNETRTAPEPNSTGTESSGNVTIRITADGFEPANVTVKKGATVTFVNNDTKLRWPASGPHPTHTNYPEFDPKQGIAAGASWAFTFDRVGAWGFHDHLNATQFGRVTVTE